ncbi:C-terminal binding protein [Paenibacillus sp. FSL H7-0331]|uniref:C-terminal binding protein n=1 Tax=Paenibacillus sp. FSL H7-0331 TaxID=1920421 RepID=UPI0009700E38|nr:C-terminal binding protein [Paenibacillus sp. FSL H7-0331]OMF20213.1 hydroxyacid dehydrogenase [Paenibacillus sp. FSL H7-0331]
MRQWKVVVTDWEYPDLRFEEAVFQAYGNIKLVVAQCQTEEEVIEVCRDADAMINQYAPISRKVLEQLENCKVITRYGVGVDTIDLEAAREKGICVANVPDYCVDEVSDHALALLLSWTRKVTLANHSVKNGIWDFKVTQPIYRLRGQTIGLIGFGKIPQSLAEKVKPLGLRVIVADPYFTQEAAVEKGVELVSLRTLCKEADYISVHAPLTAATRGMIGEEQFSLMKKEAILINTSRGPIVNEQALIAALEKGIIAGAALDVVESEPIDSDNPLLRMEQVIITPHVAWYSEQSAAELRSKAAMGVVDVLVHGEYPKYLVNAKVKDRVQLKLPNAEDRYAKLV